MAYEHQHLKRQKVLYNNANAGNPLRCQLVLDGEKDTASAATITVYKPPSTTALVSAQAMSQSGTISTYAIDTTTTASWPIFSGYRAEVSYTDSNGAAQLRHYMFDVVKFLLDLHIGFDQLVALDDRVRGMANDGDEDFSELIEACRDVIQAEIEAKVISDGHMIENMILDYSAVSVAARFYMLAQIFRSKGDAEWHESYSSDYRATLEMLLGSLRYDEGQSGEEATELKSLIQVRIKY